MNIQDFFSMKIKRSSILRNQQGVLHLLPLLIVAVVGMLSFLFVSQTGPFKDNMLSSLYPKKSSSAAGVTGGTAVISTTLSPGSTIDVNQEVTVQLRVQNPVDEANLFAAVLTYPTDKFDFVRIDSDSVGSFITQWVARTNDVGTGTVQVIGGVPNPGFKSANTVTLAHVVLRAKAAGSATIAFHNDSAVYRNSDNANILAPTTNATVTVNPAPTPTPTASPTPTPVPTARPFSAVLNAAQEVQSPAVVSNGTGSGSLVLAANETSVVVNLSFSGLTSTQTAAHIHGPAASGSNAGILFSLPNGQVTNHTISNLTAQQVQDLKNGLWYFNVHTQNYSGGEIRGQILPGVGSPLPSSTATATPTASPTATPTPNAQAALNLSVASQNVSLNQTFPVEVKFRSDSVAAGTIVAYMVFDATKLEVVGPIQDGNWGSTQVLIPEKTFNNTTGTINLVAGIPNPGLQTSGTDFHLATVNFRTKATGQANIAFASNAVVKRNSDTSDLVTTKNSLTMNIVGTTPTPTPTASPTATPAPVACALSSASWNITSNPVTEGNIVSLNVNATGGCSGKQVTFAVREDDGALGFDTTKISPAAANLVVSQTNGNNYTATSTWQAEFQEDGFAGINNPPEYYFVVSLAGANSINSADPKLQVNKSPTTVYQRGDANRDGTVNLQDLSVLLTNWNKTENVPDEMDHNDDGVINAFDFSGLVSILRQLGVLKGT